MNWKHLESLCRGVRLYFGEAGDTKLLSDVSVLFQFNDEFPITQRREIDPRVSSLWAGVPRTDQISAIPLGSVKQRADGKFYRTIGGVAVDERYVRIFGKDKQWSVMTESKMTIVVCREGAELLAMCMPTRLSHPCPVDEEPTDDAVFAAWAGPHNEWYCASLEKLESEIGDRMVEIDMKEMRVGEIEGEINELNLEIADLRERLQSMKAPA